MVRDIIKIAGRFLGVLSAMGALWVIISYFTGEPGKGNADGLWIFVSLGFNIWLLLEFCLYTRRQGQVSADEPPLLADVLIEELQLLAEKGEYETILRYRDSFSRVLYIGGKLQERVAIGLIAEEAAVKLNDKCRQAAILIDDLGWSLVSLHEHKEALKYLRHGQEVAVEIKDYYWIAKAFRHAAGILVEARNYADAYKDLVCAQNAAANISDEKVKKEMIAGIKYGMALTAIYDNRLDDARDHTDSSETLRNEIGDKSRIVKIYSLRGKLEEAQGNTALAKDHYRKGLQESESVGRRDEMIRNCMGLARVSATEGERQKSQQYRKQAKDMLKSTPVPCEIEDIELKLRRLK